MQDISSRKTRDSFVKHRKAPVAVSGRRMIFFLLTGILFFILLSSVINLGRKYFAIREKLADLKVEEAQVANKQAALNEQNEFLKTPEGQERLLREKYNLVKPGEGVIVVTNPDADMLPPSKHSFFGNVWRGILGIFGIGKK